VNDARGALTDEPLEDAPDEAAAPSSEDALGQAALDDPRGWEPDEPVTEPMSIEALLERRDRVSARKDAVSFSAAQGEPSTRALSVPTRSALGDPPAPEQGGHWANFRRSFEQTSLPRKASAALIIGLVAVSLLNARRRAPEPHPRQRPAASQASLASTGARATAAREAAEIEGSIVAAGAEPSSSAGPKGGPTLQREAADAVLAGDLKHALSLYRRLAEADPRASVYQEAVRVIEARVEKAGRSP
jgi:hypothetical protein